MVGWKSRWRCTEPFEQRARRTFVHQKWSWLCVRQQCRKRWTLQPINRPLKWPWICLVVFSLLLCLVVAFLLVYFLLVARINSRMTLCGSQGKHCQTDPHEARQPLHSLFLFLFEPSSTSDSAESFNGQPLTPWYCISEKVKSQRTA